MRLICPACGEPPPDVLAWRCPNDGRPYELVDALRPGSGALRGQGVWRYRDWLPDVEPVSLGEPTTPLVSLPWHSGEAMFKLDASEPTGSFKDRGTALLAGWLTTLGVDAPPRTRRAMPARRWPGTRRGRGSPATSTSRPPRRRAS